MSVLEMQIAYTCRVLNREWPARVVRDAPQAAEEFRGRLEQEPVEVFAVICLSTRYEPLSYYEASRGCLNSTVVHPREVFKAAILSNAAAIVVAHNHPSGDPLPSVDDIALTERLKAAGQVLGIELVDHIVIGHNGRQFSFREAGRL